MPPTFHKYFIHGPEIIPKEALNLLKLSDVHINHVKDDHDHDHGCSDDGDDNFLY